MKNKSLFKTVFSSVFALCLVVFFSSRVESSELWETVSGDFRSAVLAQKNQPEVTEATLPNTSKMPEMVEIEYNGKIVSVDIADIILMADGKGGETYDLYEPEKYEDQYESQYENTNPSGNGKKHGVPGGSGGQSNQSKNPGAGMQEITEREYEEEQRARQWANIIEDLNLRKIDEKALELVREFGEAKNAVPPITGVAGSVVIAWSSYTPKIVCRPMYVTDIILQPGETVTGVHPGDPIRWTFVPSTSGTGENAQTHVLIKPLAADISTNLIVNTDRRTYQLDLMSSATNFVPSVSFSYPSDSLKAWDTFLSGKKKERENNVTLASGYSINPEDLYLDYEVRGSDKLRWKPQRVWDDGVKTYIQFKKDSAKKSVEAPILVVYEHKKEVLVNYRAAPDMYVVDRVFDKAALIVGTGAHQDRVVITRLKNRQRGTGL
jgi:type IV secretion system protein VirB9